MSEVLNPFEHLMFWTAKRNANAHNALVDQYVELQREVERLRGDLAVERANNAGLAAAFDALKAELPKDNRLLKASGRKNKDGSNKSVIGAIFSDALIAAAKKLGIRNPETLIF